MASPPHSPSPTKPSVSNSTVVAGTAAASTSPPAKPAPAAWSHQETVHLIQIYQDKWYANKRAHLKAPQWEEVAAAVAARSGDSGNLPPKTPTQCRHKIEKLRKRFRAERQRGGGGGFPFYYLMDRLERGPKVIARPITVVPHRAKTKNFRNFQAHFNDYDEDEEDDDYDHDNGENEDDEEEVPYGRSQSINYILQRPTVVNRFPSDRNFSDSAVPGFVPRHLAPKRMREEAMDAEEDQEELQEDSERARKAAISKMAGEIRAFAEAYVRMESVKMKMMKEAEQSRLEMESKRMEMILDSQKKIVEAIADAFGSPRKVQ